MSVVILGPLPPPFGGAGHVTRVMTEVLAAHGNSTRTFPTNAGALAHQRTFRHHWRKACRTAGHIATILKFRRDLSVAYIVPDAGVGQIYTLCYTALMRCLKAPVFFHHHSDRYVTAPSALMRAICRTAPSAVHVLLTRQMASDFAHTYRARCVVVDNSAFVGHMVTMPPTPVLPAASETPALAAAPDIPVRPLRIGHLGNLCADKGTDIVLDIFESLREQGVAIELHLAGPVVDDQVSSRIRALSDSRDGTFRHWGPVKGPVKQQFYEAIDVQVLPTRFAQEGAPLVIYEAASAGVPTVATPLGRIPEVLVLTAGTTAGTADETGTIITAMAQANGDPRAARQRVMSNFAALQQEAEMQLAQLLALVARATIDR